MATPIKVPKSIPDVLSSRETVDVADNPGNVVEPKTFDAGIDSGVGHFEGAGTQIKFDKA